MSKAAERQRLSESVILLSRTVNMLTLALNEVINRVEALERRTFTLETESCPPAARAATQIVAAKAFPQASSRNEVIEDFELIHRSILEAIKRETRDEPLPNVSVQP